MKRDSVADGTGGTCSGQVEEHKMMQSNWGKKKKKKDFKIGPG